MGLDDRFHEYFRALDRAGDEDRCYLCRRTPAEVKQFFGFDEDGTPLEAEEHGIEWSTAAARPVPERLRELALAAAAGMSC